MTTIASLKKLEEAGFSREQATTIVEAVNDGAATKADLDQLRTEMRGEFTLLKWMMGALLTLVTSFGITILALLLRAKQ